MPLYRLPPWNMRTLPTVMLAEEHNWALQLIGVPAAWQTTRGAYPGGKVKILSIDTGVQVDPFTHKADHPALAGQLKLARNFTNSPFGYGDQNGHGTATIALMAAKKSGMIEGVCPEAEFYVAKALGDDGSGDNRWIANAIRWGDEELDVDIISFSGGSQERDDEVLGAIAAFNQRREQRFFIAAAGNDGERTNDVDWPAASELTVAVGAINQYGVVARFSSRGAAVDVAAPGEGVPSAALRSRFGVFDGTSFAAPLMAGVAALLLAKHRLPGAHATPLRNHADLIAHLQAVAKRVGDLDGNTYPILRADEMLARDDQPPQSPPPVRRGLSLGPFVWNMPAKQGDLISIGIRDDSPPDERENAAKSVAAMFENMAMVCDQKSQ